MRSRPEVARRVYRRRMALPFLALQLALIAGCGGLGLEIEKIPSTESPSEQVGMLESDLSAAQGEGIPALSPTWFDRSQRSLSDARERLEGGDDAQSVFTAVARARAELARARSFAQVVRTGLPRAVEARDAAREAGATAFAEEYAVIEESFLELTRAVENDDLTSAQGEQSEVVKQFRDLELRAIQERTLGEVRRLIQEAKKEGAREFAPEALDRAEKQLADVEVFIERDRYAREAMSERAAEALFEANRALHINREAQNVSKMSPEAIAVAEERRLSGFARALKLGELGDQSFLTQRDNVQRGIVEVVKDRDFLVNRNEKMRAELEQLEARVADLEGENAIERERAARLDAERRFNDLYAEVSGYFDPSEAEVYRRGQSLVVRLRGIQFPVGQYVLMPDDYPLLSKVQRAVRAFGEPRVTIEGHTDTTGSVTTNELLSQQRADAVMEYLVANNTLPRDLIAAVGKGPSVPLATNVTPEGRAMNRRIDVIVDASPRAFVPDVAAER